MHDMSIKTEGDEELRGEVQALFSPFVPKS
jgi:hypothetical protein